MVVFLGQCLEKLFFFFSSATVTSVQTVVIFYYFCVHLAHVPMKLPPFNARNYLTGRFDCGMLFCCCLFVFKCVAFKSYGIIP